MCPQAQIRTMVSAGGAYLMIRLVSNRMMDHHVVVLHSSCCLADDMDQLHLLGHGSCHAIESTEFA